MGERTCTVEGCGKPVKARGWCQNHYMQARRTARDPSGGSIACDGCGRMFRPWSGRGHTICVDCRRQPKNDYSVRACIACGENFTPRKAPRVAALCPPCQMDNKRKNAAARRERNAKAYRGYRQKYRAKNPGYQQRWVHENPEKAKALRGRAYTAARQRDLADPMTAAARRRVSWQRYREAIAAGRLPERVRDPVKMKMADFRRRARKYGVGYEDFDRFEIFDRDGWRCQLCDEPIDPSLSWPDPGSVSLDHIIPLSKGGPHSRANTQTACLGCNWRKHAFLPEAS